MKKLIHLFVSLAIITCLLPMTSVNVSANENTDVEEPKVVEEYKVYNGHGEVVYIAKTFEDAEAYILNGNARSINYVKLAKFGAKLGGYVSGILTVLTVIELVYRTVQYANGEAEFIDIIDVIVPVSFLQELAQNGKTAYLYGTTGVNPYPPHSYQGATWLKNNTYYIAA